MFSEGERYGYNFIIRNDQGSMVLAKNGCMRGSQDAFTTEAMSSREALTWQKAHGFTKVKVDGSLDLAKGTWFHKG